MNAFYEMFRKISSSPYNNQMLRFAAPLRDHFGINHFWYYKITKTGHYSFLGTHTAWNEFAFCEALLKHFPCLRHPNNLEPGINLMKANADNAYKKTLDIAWEKFHINFNINLISKIPEGIEAFGFATCFNDPLADQRLLNELPLLRHFTKIFKTKHKKLFHLLEDNQVDLTTQFGSIFYERSKILAFPHTREQFLCKIGYEWVFSLTPRERDIVQLVAQGFPASYIAKQLKLCSRTVENYIATIKSKLSCQSKVELISKTQILLQLCSEI